MRRTEAKSSRITSDVIVYLGNLRESTEKLLELVREISKVAECRIRMYVKYRKIKTISIQLKQLIGKYKKI